jgi:NhaP-type Na+/H+ or K+/H+ antiporter
MSSLLFSIGGIIIIMMFMLYMILASLVEKHKPICGHEAGLVILVGILISWTALQTGHHEFNKMITFDPNFFFYFCLPPIIFASGYNMKRKKFFENF